MKEKNNQNKEKEKKEDCPLCNVSEETLERLKKTKQKAETSKPKPKKKFSLKFKLLTLIVVLIVIGFIFFQFSQTFSVKPKNLSSLIGLSFKGIKLRDIAPDFKSEDVYGNEIILSDFRNKKPVLLVFWATWCNFCSEELPYLKAFTEKYKNEVQVIVIPSSEIKKTIKKYIEEKDINFLMALDEKREIWNTYLVRGTPSHFLIDKEGKIMVLRPGIASMSNLETMLRMLK